MKNSQTLKQIGLFIGGALVVAVLTFFAFKGPDQTNKEILGTSSTPSASLDNVDNVAQDQTDESTISDKENIDMSNQKMTVEQKLAVKAPTETIDASKNYTATLKTNLGDIVIALDVKNRPQTVNNFVYLARLGFYDDVIFHRVIDGFMIQGGDPLGTGTGGPSYKFADELTPPNSNAKGTIAMANAGPNTNGSQFFINLVDNNYLDTKHTVFGKVTGGMDVVEKIGKTPVDQNDQPLTPMVINSVEVVQD